MHDNGAFSIWKKTTKPVTDWTPYYRWVEPLLGNAAHWAVIPDEIDAGSKAQEALLRQWPFGSRGAPVWHMDEPITRLLELADTWPRICIGSTKDYKFVGSLPWHRCIDKAFEELVKRHRFLPWIHMLRGMKTVTLGYPFASVDSTDVGRNHAQRNDPPLGRFDDTDFNAALFMANRWDTMNCPGVWVDRHINRET